MVKINDITRMTLTKYLKSKKKVVIYFFFFILFSMKKVYFNFLSCLFIPFSVNATSVVMDMDSKKSFVW